MNRNRPTKYRFDLNLIDKFNLTPHPDKTGLENTAKLVSKSVFMWYQVNVQHKMNVIEKKDTKNVINNYKRCLVHFHIK